MLIRATIVLLAVLNLGAAAWWLWRPDPVPATIAQPTGVPRLVLLEEIAPAPEPAPPPTATEPAALPDPQRLEPEAEPAPTTPPPVPAATPRSPVEPETMAGEPRCDGAGVGEARGWRVELPPAADLATARATARRIADAGFDDYLVLTEGEHANGIALGMFSTEAAAQRRRAALRAAGFPARCVRIAASTPA